MRDTLRPARPAGRSHDHPEGGVNQMPESFGARLRRQREQQQIALKVIAEQTKIKMSLLEGLERDDTSRWPAGIFRRAWVRDYAHAIGLPPDAVLREFLEVHPDPDAVPVPAAARATWDGQAGTSSAPPSRLRQGVDAAVRRLSRFRAERAGEQESHTSRPATGERPPVPAAPASPEGPDLWATAQLCTRLAGTTALADVTPLLPEAAPLLGALVSIVWIRDSRSTTLRPALTYGYPDRVIAQLTPVDLDADNATAVACRSAHLCAVDAGDQSCGALAVPLMTPAGCAGVLAIEFRHGARPTESTRAVAIILAAQLARLLRAPASHRATAGAGTGEGGGRRR